MSRKVIINENQLKMLVGHIKNQPLNEDVQDVLMGAAQLMGIKLSGFNDKIAQEALKSPKTLNAIKKYLEGEQISDIISGLEEMGMRDVAGKLEGDRFEIQKRFDDIAFVTDGVKGGLVINVGDT